MIRWRYILVRLGILAAVLLLFHYAAGPVAQFVVVRSLQAATGARVDVASTEIGLFPPRLHLRGLAIADPRKEMRNAFEAEHVYLAVDGKALLRRRYEVADGRISGIRIGGKRSESGRLEVVPRDVTPESEGPSMLHQWCQTLAADAESQAREFGDSLQTVIESQRIRQQWESQYEALRAEAKQIEDDARALKMAARGIENPLRDLPALQDAMRRAEQMRERVQRLSAQLDQLPSRFQSDVQAIDRARRADQQRIAAYLPEPLTGAPAELGPELLGELVRAQLEQVREYLDSGRSIAEATVLNPHPERARGETVALETKSHPQWLFRQCSIDGFLSVDDEQYTMRGVLENVTSDTDRLEGPMRARLRLEGPRIVRIDYQRFYDAPRPKDHLRVHWPQLNLPTTHIGGRNVSPNGAMLSLDGGNLELWVDIEARGEEIQGRLVSKQTGTQVDLRAGDRLAENVMVRTLQTRLREIDRVEIDATFAGNWRQMDLRMNTNLTKCIADSVQAAVAAQVAETRARLAAEVQREYEQQSAELKAWASDQQASARELLAQSDSLIQEMGDKVASELGAADAYLGRLRSALR